MILDASALLAWLWREAGSQRVEELLIEGRCGMSSVNLAEVVAKVLDKGLAPEQVDTFVAGLEMGILPFDAEGALQTALLRPSTRHLGLSLADRACLALAKPRGVPAVTADRLLEEGGSAIGVQIICIRS